MELRREGQLRGETPLWKAGGPFIGLGRGDIEPGLMTKCGNQGVLRERIVMGSSVKTALVSSTSTYSILMNLVGPH